jgi:hypothetical protein
MYWRSMRLRARYVLLFFIGIQGGVLGTGSKWD